MKKLVSVILLVLLLCSTAYALEIDLSGLSLAELIDLQKQITMAMWETEEWQEVTVPAGMYKIGDAIPAGRWVITAAPGQCVFIEYGDAVNDAKTEIDAYNTTFYEHSTVTAPDHWYYANSTVSSMTYDLIDGAYILFEEGSVIFTPFAGYDFNFK